MPLVRVDIHEALSDLRPRMSDAIHRGLVEGWGFPADDLFQIFTVHPVGDLVYSRTFPDADRSDIVFVQITAFAGYSPEVKQRGASLVVGQLAALGLRRDDILIAITENGEGDWLTPAKED